MNFKYVKIKWTDAIACSSKAFIEDVIKDKLPITLSCGWLIKEDEEKIILASMMYDEILEHYQIIPKGMIKEIKELKEVD